MKITALTENTASSPKFYSEHGLSLYIETGDKRILFDMGQSDVFKRNADILGIDLAGVDFAVISHGHYDHGGGLETFFGINQRAKVYIRENAFEPHYNGCEKYIGLKPRLKESNRFVFVGDEYEIERGIKLYSLNDKKLKYPINPYGLNQKAGNEFIPDSFTHEHYLEIEEGKKKILISGCSHKGILNIENIFKPDILVGGFHFKKLKTEGRDAQILKDSAKELMSYPTTYYTCHCTGEEQYDVMKEIMGDSLHYLRAGETIIL